MYVLRIMNASPTFHLSSMCIYLSRLKERMRLWPASDLYSTEMTIKYGSRSKISILLVYIIVVIILDIKDSFLQLAAFFPLIKMR